MDESEVFCRHCGNWVLKLAGERQCSVCQGPFPWGPLTESDRQALVSRLAVGYAATEEMLVDIAMMTIVHAAQILGISEDELEERARQFTGSTDRIEWIKQMA